MRVWVRVNVVIDLKQHIICGQLSSYPFSFSSALLKHNSPHISSVLCPHKCSTRHPGYETSKCYHNDMKL